MERFTRTALSIVVVSICLCLCSCEEKNVQLALNVLTAALTAMKDQKALVEQFGRDIKATFKPTDAAYARAQNDYSVARSVNQKYLTALRLSQVVKGIHDLSTIATQSRSATAQFISTSTRLLSPSAIVNTVDFTRLTYAPDDLHSKLASLPESQYQRVSELVDQLQWAPWDAL